MCIRDSYHSASMARALRYALMPAIAALAALFMIIPQEGAEATVTMTGDGGTFTFEPAEVRLDSGEQIAFVNDTGTTHTATCTARGCFDSGDVQPGQTKFVTVDRAGSFDYFCRYHGREGMSGRVLAGSEAARAADSQPSPSPSPS